MVEKTVWLDEKGFTIEIPFQSAELLCNGKGRKSDIPDENLPSSTNKMFKNAMISAAILCYGVTKIFFINNIAIKVNI